MVGLLTKILRAPIIAGHEIIDRNARTKAKADAQIRVAKKPSKSKNGAKPK